jgi:hypothetical protein
MALMDALFGKKKKEFKAACQITKEPLEKGFGYLLTTAQIVTSKKYWDMVMTEPETMSYTISHFNMIFEKYATVTKPWIVSDSIINYFEVDKASARADAKKWWETEGSYLPNQTGSASDTLESDSFKSARDYAVLEAGRGKVKIAS